MISSRSVAELLHARLDECALYVTDGAATDVESYNAIRPGMVTLPYSLLIGITTPYARRGLAYTKYQRHFGKSDAEVLVIQAPSRALNPTIDQSVVDAATKPIPKRPMPSGWACSGLISLVSSIPKC
jgi:hypothetical protein